MIELGDVVPNLAITVTDASTPPVAADGGSVVAVITLPDGVTTVTPPVQHPATGQYRVQYVATVTGLHMITWTITGLNAGGFNDTFVVESPATGLVSLAEVKTHLRITRTQDDEILRSLILAASDACESAEGTNRLWHRRVITGEQHDVSGYITLTHRPVQSITAIRLDGVAQDLSGFDLFASTGEIYAANGLVGSIRRNSVSIDYVAGQNTTVPPLVRDGVLEMVRHLYGLHRGGSNLPRQEEPDYTTSVGYLIPNRVAMAWRAHAVGF
jgi:uncharacterized phiE125 gp8 family phage protein